MSECEQQRVIITGHKHLNTQTSSLVFFLKKVGKQTANYSGPSKGPGHFQECEATFRSKVHRNQTNILKLCQFSQTLSQPYIFLSEKTNSRGLWAVLSSTLLPCCCCCSHVRAEGEGCAPVLSVLLETPPPSLVPTSKMTTDEFQLNKKMLIPSS